MLLWDVGPHRGPQLPLAAECVAMARERPALAHRAHRGAPRDRQRASCFRSCSTGAGRRCWRDRRAREAFLEAHAARSTAERHAKHEGAVCVQEPNVKEGVGGLRDLHTVLWVAHARLGRARASPGSRPPAGSRSASTRPRAAPTTSCSRVRNEAHFATRPQDRPAHARPAARRWPRRLGYAAARRPARLRAVHARLLPSRLGARRVLPQRSCCATSSRPPRRLFAALRRAPPGPGLRGRAAAACAPAASLPGGGRGAARGVRGGAGRGRRRSPTSSQPRGPRAPARWWTRALPRRRARRAARLPRRAALARPRRPRAARDARDGLPRPLPARVRPGHASSSSTTSSTATRWTSTRCARSRRSTRSPRARSPACAPFGRGARRGRGRRPALPRDAAPRHRQGPGRRPRASAARRSRRASARASALDERAAEDVVFLVAAHLEMSQISQQRDLTRAGLIAAFAERVGTPGAAEPAAAADLRRPPRRSAPGIWNEWKGALLWELYNRTREHLAGHPGGGDPGRRRPGAGRRRLLPRVPARPRSSATSRSCPSATCARPTPTPWSATSAWSAARGDAPVAVRVARPGRRPLHRADGRRRRPARACSPASPGTLTAHGVDILSVDLFSRARRGRDRHLPAVRGVGAPAGASRAPRARRAGRSCDALGGRLDVAAAVERWRRAGPPAPARAWGRAARGPVGALRPRGLGHGDRDRGEGPGPAGARLDDRRRARAAGARHPLRARSPPRRRWRSTCST